MRVHDATLELDPSDGHVGPSQLGRLSYQRVRLHDYGPDDHMPEAVVRDAFSRRLLDIRRAPADRDTLLPYRPFDALSAERPRVLNVFPGAPIPLDKGSNQRAFNLTWHLNRHGIATDLLLTTASRSALPRLADVLTAIAPKVHTYRNNKPLLGARHRLRRTTERVVRVAGGRLAKPPDLFVERLATRSSHDGKRRLTELVRSGRYHTVIVNFAWMSGMMRAARAAAPASTRWVCDTHDVQFVRNATQNRGQRRLWVDDDAERRAELDALREYDAVLAISESDAEELERHLPAERVVLAPSGFDYAELPLPETPAQPPYRFGFIGRSMGPNLEALALLLQQWWPAMRAAAPGSELVVAGTICKHRDARALAGRSDSVRLLGFVPTLASFYDQIDVAVNPVVVQGGLNFKSVEPAAASRLLMTTSLGKRCLGHDAPVLIADSAAAAAEHVAELVAAPARLHESRRALHDWYQERFSERAALGALRELLS